MTVDNVLQAHLEQHVVKHDILRDRHKSLDQEVTVPLSTPPSQKNNVTGPRKAMRGTLKNPYYSMDGDKLQEINLLLIICNANSIKLKNSQKK